MKKNTFLINVLIIISGNKSEIEQSYTSNPITLDENRLIMKIASTQ